MYSATTNGPARALGLNLVLLHGSGSYGLQWEWVADHIDERIQFAPDQRGHGESERSDGESRRRKVPPMSRRSCRRLDSARSSSAATHPEAESRRCSRLSIRTSALPR